jgi:hypothetical protein
MSERQQLNAGGAGTVSVWAIHLDDPHWNVSLTLGNPSAESKSLVSAYTYLTSAEARELAVALTRAADHYDAETARLAEEAQA